MKIWMLAAMAALVAGGAMAQGGRGDATNWNTKPNQMLIIKEITGMGGDSDYTVIAPQVAEKFKKKINHSDDDSKDDAKGWHYLEVAYVVKDFSTGDSGRQKIPILAIPEVEVTYAVLYDMTKSKNAASVVSKAKDAGAAIGWDNPKQIYVLMTDTVTYTSITPGREHYAAVCVPPSAVAIYGNPVLFSAQISVNGVQQGPIATTVAGGLPKGLLNLTRLGNTKELLPWWENVESAGNGTVLKVEGILRDRSMTPFVMAGDRYYDQVKAK